MKSRLSTIIIFTALLNFIIPIQVSNAAATWSVTSGRDSYNRPELDARYDIEYVSSSIFDNSADEIYFYLHFKNIPTANLFNDGSSWAAVMLDYDLDNTGDVRLEFSDKSLKTDRSSVFGDVYDMRTKSFLKCNVEVFTNIDESKYWIGFATSRLCIGLPGIFGLQGYSDLLGGDQISFDYAPDSYFRVTLPSASGSSAGSTSNSAYVIPSNLVNESISTSNFSAPPINLTSLSEKLSPSVVTVFCANGKGSGWVAKADLGVSLKNGGFNSFIITNHHVIESCVTSKKVTVQLNSGTQVNGTLIAWNESSDVAGIAIANSLPGLEWIGESPKQGWWVGVIGSPGSLTGILTTGIISSINNDAGTFTFTAAINPGNSGGPVFDSTGRVLGLATSKFLLSNGALAEGSGNAHGVPLLCGSIIYCIAEKKPWDAISKFTAGPTAAEIEAKAKAEAEAKAKADAAAKLILENQLKEEKIKQCLDLNGDLKVAVYNAISSKSLYPSSGTLFQGLANAAPKELDCNSIDLSKFDSILSNQKKLLSAYQMTLADAVSAAKLNVNKKITITCIKGKTTKKVTGINPICPSGYKKK